MQIPCRAGVKISNNIGTTEPPRRPDTRGPRCNLPEIRRYTYSSSRSAARRGSRLWPRVRRPPGPILVLSGSRFFPVFFVRMLFHFFIPPARPSARSAAGLYRSSANKPILYRLLLRPARRPLRSLRPPVFFRSDLSLRPSAGAAPPPGLVRYTIFTR